MKWSKISSATIGVSYYDHTKLDTPLGLFLIEWKSWKEYESYSISLNNEYINTTYSLEDAKEICITYLNNKLDKLQDFLKSKN